MQLNRAIVLQADAARAAAGAATQGGSGAGPAGGAASEAAPQSAADTALTPRAELLLTNAMTLLETIGARGPHDLSRESSIWRTYGAAARMLPSDHAFEVLWRSQNAGRLDWYGTLWLGEVAAATGHWDEAEQAYRRVDVSNLLVYRAEVNIRAEQKDLALRELDLAKASLDAVADRERAELLLLDRTGDRPSSLAGLLHRPSERATTLSRIGHGYLSIGRPAQAQAVMEQGLALAATSSPGPTVERTLRLDLATVLAQTLPKAGAQGPSGYAYYPPAAEFARVKGLVHIRALVQQALGFERSAVTCAWAGRVFMQAGDEVSGLALLSEAIRIDPLAPEAYLGVGAWYESHDLAWAARALYARAAELMPDEPLIASALAVTTYNTMAPLAALPALERAVALKSVNPYVYAFLGDCYMDLRLTADAKAIWEEGLRVSPGAEPLVGRLARLAGEGTAP